MTNIRKLMEAASDFQDAMLYDQYMDTVEEFIRELYVFSQKDMLSGDLYREFKRLESEFQAITGPEDIEQLMQIANELKDVAHAANPLGETLDEDDESDEGFLKRKAEEEKRDFDYQMHGNVPVVDFRMRGLSTGQVYDLAMTMEITEDGIVMLTDKGPAILTSAWPVFVYPTEDDYIHNLASDASWETLDGGKYMDAVNVAKKLMPQKHSKQSHAMEDFEIDIREGRDVSNDEFATALANAKLGYSFDDDYNAVPVALGKAVFRDEDGDVYLSGEYEHTSGLLNYYMEHGLHRDTGGISPNLQKFAERYNRFIEWKDPGSVGFWLI